MTKKQVLVSNPSGLHARPGAEFVKVANTFKSTIKIMKTDNPAKLVNAKSIIFLLSLGIKKDTLVELQAEGEDEVTAVETLCALIESGLGE